MKEILLFLYNPCEGPGEGVFAPLLFYSKRSFIQRRPTAGCAELNGRDAERAATPKLH